LHFQFLREFWFHHSYVRESLPRFGREDSPDYCLFLSLDLLLGLGPSLIVSRCALHFGQSTTT